MISNLSANHAAKLLCRDSRARHGARLTLRLYYRPHARAIIERLHRRVPGRRRAAPREDIASHNPVLAIAARQCRMDAVSLAGRTPKSRLHGRTTLKPDRRSPRRTWCGRACRQHQSAATGRTMMSPAPRRAGNARISLYDGGQYLLARRSCDSARACRCREKVRQPLDGYRRRCHGGAAPAGQRRERRGRDQRHHYRIGRNPNRFSMRKPRSGY